jgi:hypothetical protein
VPAYTARFVGFGLRGKARGQWPSRILGLLLVRARQVSVTLTVAVGAVEVGQSSERQQGVVRVMAVLLLSVVPKALTQPGFKLVA